MKFSEIVFVFIILALLFGAYFFIQQKIITPPEKKFETFIQPEVDIIEQQMEYYEQHSEKIDAKQEQKLKRMQKQIDTLKPQLKKAENYYQKEYKNISKLPPKQQEQELKKLMEKKQSGEDTGKHKQFRTEAEANAYYDSLRKKYPKEYSKYKKMIENE
ncbi:MAG: hypothetical protein AB1349_08035 [Elusimicrobiota bacterium]